MDNNQVFELMTKMYAEMQEGLKELEWGNESKRRIKRI